ncbi:MAG: class I SAM-dependent methyltransferase [Gammaproteobacteria bacterium]
MIRHDVDGLLMGDVAGLMSALDRLTGDAVPRVQSAARTKEAQGSSMEGSLGCGKKVFGRCAVTTHAKRGSRGDRFEFGVNWARFLSAINEERIAQAEKSLRDMLGVSDLRGKCFLDIGSGSGLFSLAARRLGAAVHSFDNDPKSVACTQELKRRFLFGDRQWLIEEGSVLDWDYLGRLGQFDVVYSWGVLHHTGAMWLALEHVASLVASGGKLFIAIYNDQGWISRYWRATKALYVRNSWIRAPLIFANAPYLFGLRWLVRCITGRPLLDRGMSLWHDMLDWIGGFPFEVAKPELIFRFYKNKGFMLLDFKTCGGRHGCNEFVFTRVVSNEERYVHGIVPSGDGPCGRH